MPNVYGAQMYSMPDLLRSLSAPMTIRAVVSF
jgi:hypothetical protein